MGKKAIHGKTVGCQEVERPAKAQEGHKRPIPTGMDSRPAKEKAKMEKTMERPKAKEKTEAKIAKARAKEKEEKHPTRVKAEV